MIPFKEDFKPSPSYKPYLLLHTLATSVISAAGIAFTAAFFVPVFISSLIFGFWGILAILFIVILLILVFAVYFWVHRYYNSTVYHLNDTEMTWKRGVLFRKTGVVPYNRITNIDIIQGPVMRLFKISNLQIQTAGSSGAKVGDISIIGVEDAEPLRAFIMDFVRGTAPVSAVTGSGESSFETQAPASMNTDMERLIFEVSEIRKLLEEQKK